jgi:hypothetical protein
MKHIMSIEIFVEHYCKIASKVAKKKNRIRGEGNGRGNML